MPAQVRVGLGRAHLENKRQKLALVRVKDVEFVVGLTRGENQGLESPSGIFIHRPGFHLA